MRSIKYVIPAIVLGLIVATQRGLIDSSFASSPQHASQTKPEPLDGGMKPQP